MKKYIDNYFIKPFKKINRQSPFIVPKSFIDKTSDEIFSSDELELSPH
jgi:hypothetical protein